MEGRESPICKNPSRHKSLRRSLSAQPEESTLSSSPYSTRKRNGLPGRSLTQYFSHQLDRLDRGGSDDSQVTQRQASFTRASKNVLQLTPRSEDSRLLPRTTPSFPDTTEFDDPVRQVYSDYERRTIVYSMGNSSSGPQYATVCDEKLTTRALKDGDDENSMGFTLRRHKYSDMVNEDSDESASGLTLRRWTLPDPSSHASEKEDPPVKFQLLRKIAKFVLLLIFVVMFLGIGTSTLYMYREALCNERRNSLLPLQELNNKLSEQVVGQEIAIDLIVEAIKTFVSSESVDPLVLWLVGSMGTGKTLTTSIMQSVFLNLTHTQVVVVSLLPPDKPGIRWETKRLLHNLDSCALNLVIIDGWDVKTNIPLSFLQNLFTGYYRKNRDNGHSRLRLMLVLSGTQGSEGINNIYFELHTKGTATREELQSEISRLGTSIHEATSLGTVTRQYTLVPFLPLDVSAVRMCVRREFQKLKRTDVILDEWKLRKVTEDVVSHLEFVPLSSVSSPVFSVTGCKRVHSLLAVLLPSLNPPL